MSLLVKWFPTTVRRALSAIFLSIVYTSCAIAADIAISVDPTFVYRSGGQYTMFSDTPEEAFNAEKAFWDSEGSHAVNLHPHPGPDAITQNGIPVLYISDLEVCSTNGCHIIENSAIAILSFPRCPETLIKINGNDYYYVLKQTNEDLLNRLMSCVLTIPETQPCNDCEARANPIHPGTGQKFEVETDYASATGGLQFKRIYRSNPGYFSMTGFLIDNSISSTSFPGCYRDSHGHADGQNTGVYCFPYKSDGTQTYNLLSAEGRVIAFSGAPGSITSKADVNDRLNRRINSAGVVEWVAHRANNSVEIYSSDGKLTQKLDSDGRSRITYIYSDHSTPSSIAPRVGLLIRMSDQFGRQLNFTYDALARMVKMTDPNGGTFIYGYDSIDNMVSVTYPDATQRIYHYNELENINDGIACPHPRSLPRALTGITQEDGQRFSTFKYACNGKAVSSEHAGGIEKYSFIYGVNNTATEIDPLGTSRTLSFSETLSVMRPIGITQSMPGSTVVASSSTAYDINGNAINQDDLNGNRVCSDFDLSRNLEVSRIGGLSTSTDCASVTASYAELPVTSRKVSSQWHPDWRLKIREAAPGKFTSWVYNGQPDPFNSNVVASCAPSSASLPDGKPIAVLCKQVEQATTDVDGHLGFSATLQAGVVNRVNSWTYNGHGQMLTADGPRTDVNDTTTYTYYTDTTIDHSVGDLQSITNAAGKVTQFTQYNPHGQVLRSIDPNGVITLNTYDSRQRLTSTSIAGQTSTYTYDAAGQLKRMTLPSGGYAEYEYDAAHRQSAVVDNLGNRIDYTLDNAGNRIAENVKDPTGNLQRSLSRVIDPLGRVQQTTGRE